MILTYKVSMAGPYHNDINLTCQDAFAIKTGNDGLKIFAVADGLGSELYSDIGSAVAVETAVDYCAEHITHDMKFDAIKKIMNNAFVYAYRAVLTRAAEDGNDSDEYDTTLCMGVYDGEHLYYAQAGDSGMVVLLQNGEYFRVTTQQRDEEGRVFPLCWGPDKWKFGFVEQPVSAVMAMTDGVFEQICPPLMRKKDVDINIPLARNFMDRFDCDEESIQELEEAAYEYLEHYPRVSLDDDKTIIVLINTERKPEKKEEAYYAIPDWKVLREEAEKTLSNHEKLQHEVEDIDECTEVEADSLDMNNDDSEETTLALKTITTIKDDKRAASDRCEVEETEKSILDDKKKEDPSDVL